MEGFPLLYLNSFFYFIPLFFFLAKRLKTKMINLEYRSLFLILFSSGCGFIGRNMVQYLVENDLTNKIRVVDKTPPQMAWLNERHARYFENENVEFLSANLKNSSKLLHFSFF